MKPHSFRLPLLAPSLLALAISMPLPVLAQGQPVLSQQDVRPAEATADLNAHLARLGSNPRDVSALIGAGEAALDLNDPRAATGFFARADEIESGNGRIKAGLGRAMLELQNPAEALRLFEQATRMGQPDRAFLSDRGLARDLTGDPVGAQRDYQAALRFTPDDPEILRRYAVSLGISGQVDAADKAVQPLLYKSDRAAWRNRAFVYAMNGRQKEAREITHKVMPLQLADAIQPYMDRMPGLTPAQRAAAVHFGTFPAAGLRMAAAPEVPPPAAAQPAPVAVAATKGRDRKTRGRQLAQAETPPVVQRPAEPVPPAYVSTPAPAPVVTPAPAPVDSASLSRARPTSTNSLLDTSGKAATQAVAGDTAAATQLANARRSGERVSIRINQRVGDTPTQIAQKEAAAAEAQRKAQSVRPVEPNSQQPVRSAQVQGPPAPDQPVQMAAAEPPRQTYSAPTAQTPVPMPAPVPQTPVIAQAPAQPAAAPATPQAAVETPAPAPNPQATRTLADIIRELQVPDEEKQQRVAAVDLTEVAALQDKRRLAKQAAADKAKKEAAAKAKAEADAKAKEAAAEKARLAKNPARAWVQVGTGQSLSALSFTMKGLRKKYDALEPKSAFTAPWGRTNRLVVGPFASFTKARAFEADMKKDGADVFAWQSDAGEEVMPVGGK